MMEKESYHALKSRFLYLHFLKTRYSYYTGLGRSTKLVHTLTINELLF